MDSYFLLVMEHLWLLSLTFWIGEQAINLVFGSSGMASLTATSAKKTAHLLDRGTTNCDKDS